MQSFYRNFKPKFIEIKALFSNTKKNCIKQMDVYWVVNEVPTNLKYFRIFITHDALIIYINSIIICSVEKKPC